MFLCAKGKDKSRWMYVSYHSSVSNIVVQHNPLWHQLHVLRAPKIYNSYI